MPESKFYDRTVPRLYGYPDSEAETVEMMHTACFTPKSSLARAMEATDIALAGFAKAATGTADKLREATDQAQKTLDMLRKINARYSAEHQEDDGDVIGCAASDCLDPEYWSGDCANCTRFPIA